MGQINMYKFVRGSLAFHDELSTLFDQDADRLVIEGGFTSTIALFPNGQQGLVDPWKRCDFRA